MKRRLGGTYESSQPKSKKFSNLILNGNAVYSMNKDSKSTNNPHKLAKSNHDTHNNSKKVLVITNILCLKPF